ncbi:MAG: TIGR02206 family membrane protein [Gemmatimonadetes bacterium]|jgi:hypothetical integral membrane protein (TIGR02206 family)|nr:TIGR02206 family membrane protein [Gemmatimonadota bacterium]MBT7858805.1 TIGR02206 family membrane protein [Gemmatimonadota bacterium]
MELLSTRHLFWLGVTVLFVVGCINMRRLPLTCRGHKLFKVSVFSLVLVSEFCWFGYRHIVADVALVRNLPLHLCDISVFVMFVALATDSRRFAELSYFPGVVGALLAVCLPAISESGAIRTIAEIRYFVTHIALVGIGFYFTFGRHYRPPVRAVLRSYAAVHVYAVVITPLNLLLGTNYFFTLSAPKQIAFIQHYPHWLFVVAVSMTFLILFSLMYLPFVRQDP